MKRLLQILLIPVSAAYPLLWYWGRERGWFVWLAGGMAVLWALRALTQADRFQRGMSLLAAAFFVLVLLLRLPQTLYWYPVWVNLLMLALFGGSLFARQTVVERLARLQKPDLPPQGVAYTRRVTQIWCVFFVINGSISAWLAWRQEAEWWAFYTGVLAYVLMGVLMGGEWLYRKCFIEKDS